MVNEVVIIDYDCGNLFSLEKAFHKLGAKVLVSDDPNVIKNAQRLVLPGVGSYSQGIQKIQERELQEIILDYVNFERPLLGICLGMQLLVDSSEEFGFFEGLKLIKGQTKKIIPLGGEKVPHIGWSPLEINTHHSLSKKFFCEGSAQADFYFVHSYGVFLGEQSNSLAKTIYGGVCFDSVIARDNILGCQFHPEISGFYGLKLLQNFLNL